MGYTSGEGTGEPGWGVNILQPLLSMASYRSNQRDQHIHEVLSASLCTSQYLGKVCQVMDEQGWLQIIVLVLLTSSPLGPYTNTGHFSALICCYRSLPHSETNHLESWCGSVTLIKLCFAPESCICSVCTVCKLYKLQEKLISVIQISAQLLKLTVNTNYTESFQCCWEAPHTKHVTKFTEVDTKTRKNKLENITDNRSQGNFAQKTLTQPY